MSSVSPPSTWYNPDPLKVKENSPKAFFGTEKRFQIEKQLKLIKRYVPHSYTGLDARNSISAWSPRPMFSKEERFWDRERKEDVLSKLPGPCSYSSAERDSLVQKTLTKFSNFNSTGFVLPKERTGRQPT